MSAVFWASLPPRPLPETPGRWVLVDDEWKLLQGRDPWPEDWAIMVVIQPDTEALWSARIDKPEPKEPTP